jgi:hypothetical protein
MAATIIDLGNISNTETLPDGDYIVTGLNGDNTLTFGSGNDQLTLGNGNNTLTLNGGTVQIVAGSGNNTVTTTGTGADTVTLTSGNNTVSVGDGPDVISAGDGLNIVTAGNGNDIVTLGNGFDQVTTGNGNSQITAGNGAGDTITVGTGSNTILLGNGSADIVHTGAGNNTLTLSAAAASDDSILGALTSGDGTGNTLVLTTAGVINASGVSGFDTYKLASGGANSLTLTNANFARLPGPITIEGGDTGSTIDASGLSAVHAVAIHASSGTDILTGGAGADTFYGAAGNETIDGGAGIDTMVLQGPASGYTINVVGPVTTITGAGVVDTLTNVENIRYAPAAPTGLALTPVSDSGASNTDNLTNVTLPTFVGAGENGDTITLYDGSTTFGTGTVAGGIWSITATVPLTTGANTFTATQTNTLGDVSLASAPLTVRLDTVALAPAALVLTAASDSGASSSDHITNVTLPTVTGTGENGATVTLFDGGTAIGTGTVTGGAWSITATVPLVGGVNDVYAMQTDLAGNISAPSSDLFVTLLTAAPAPGAVALTPASDTGASNTDDITKRTLPRITGTGDNGDTVTLSNGGTIIGTGTVAGGVWSILTTVALTEGVNAITATQTDLAGNVSPAATLSVTLDTVALPPAALALTPASDGGASNSDDITNVTLPTVTGTGENGAVVTLFDGGTTLGTGTVSGGVWSITATVALVEGVNDLSALQTDLAGNVSTPSSDLFVTLQTGTVPPPAALALTPASDSGVSSSDDLTNVALPTITGTGVDGDTVTLRAGGTLLGTATVAGGVWSIAATAPLTVGANTITATQTDIAGNVSAPSSALTVTLKPSAPAPTALVLAPASDSGTSNSDAITNVAVPVITGLGENGDTVTLRDGATIIGTGTVAGGAWSIAATAPLLEGANAITATESDSAGNTSAASSPLNVRLKTSAPAPTALALVSPSSSTTANLTVSPLPTITGAGENGDTVTLLDGATIIGTGMVTGGAWSITATVPLIVGVNPLTAREVDVAGNVSAPSSVLNVTLDPNLPAVTAMLAPNPADAHSNGMVFSPIVVGSGDPTTIVSITEAGATVATVQSNATGAWSFDPSSLPQGIAHSLVASETDAAGNTSSTFPLTVPASRFTAVDVTTSTSGSLLGSDYAGPVGYLQAQYAYTGSDNVVISASVANVFIHGGSAEEALVAKAGSNVLEAGSGSSWLVGASGADGGTDTFFVDSSTGQATWDTLLNFHTGDSLTLWGFNATAGSMNWVTGSQGTAGFQGATLQANFGNGTGASANITLAGLSTGSAQFATSTGTSGGVDFLSLTRIA